MCDAVDTMDGCQSYQHSIARSFVQWLLERKEVYLGTLDTERLEKLRCLTTAEVDALLVEWATTNDVL